MGACDEREIFMALGKIYCSVFPLILLQSHYTHTLCFFFFFFLNNLQLLNFLEHESHLNRTVSVLLCLQEFDDISGGEKKDMDVLEGRKGKNNIRKKTSFSCSELCHGSWGLLNWWSVKSSFSNVKSCRLSPALYFTLGSQFS